MARPSPIPGYDYKWLTPQSASWPRALSHIPDAPKDLWCIGNTSLLNSWCIAIVGTRKPSQSGRDTAHSVAETLAAEGYTIVAGLARGIDAEAHQGTLKADGGKTIAVLIDIDLGNIYPSEQCQLARDILSQGGLLMSEHPVGESRNHPYELKDGWYGDQLKARDRLQSGLSFCTIPVQAGLHSGTLHTIRSTREQGQGRLVRAPLFGHQEVVLHAECHSGIQQAMYESEYFTPLDMAYRDYAGKWHSFLEFLQDYRMDSRELRAWGVGA